MNRSSKPGSKKNGGTKLATAFQSNNSGFIGFFFAGSVLRVLVLSPFHCEKQQQTEDELVSFLASHERYARYYKWKCGIMYSSVPIGDSSKTLYDRVLTELSADGKELCCEVVTDISKPRGKEILLKANPGSTIFEVPARNVNPIKEPSKKSTNQDNKYNEPKTRGKKDNVNDKHRSKSRRDDKADKYESRTPSIDEPRWEDIRSKEKSDRGDSRNKNSKRNRSRTTSRHSRSGKRRTPSGDKYRNNKKDRSRRGHSRDKRREKSRDSKDRVERTNRSRSRSGNSNKLVSKRSSVSPHK